MPNLLDGCNPGFLGWIKYKVLFARFGKLNVKNVQFDGQILNPGLPRWMKHIVQFAKLGKVNTPSSQNRCIILVCQNTYNAKSGLPNLWKVNVKASSLLDRCIIPICQDGRNAKPSLSYLWKVNVKSAHFAGQMQSQFSRMNKMQSTIC